MTTYRKHPLLIFIRSWKPYLRSYFMLTAAVLLVVALLSFIVPHKYSIHCMIAPSEAEDKTGGLSSLIQGTPISIGLSAGDTKASLTFMEILGSRTLHRAVADSLNLYDHPFFKGMSQESLTKKLVEGIDMDIKRTGTLFLQFDISTNWFPSAEDGLLGRNTVLEFSDAVLSELDRTNRNTKVTRARKARIYIERLLESTREYLDSLQQEMQEFQLANKVIALDEQTQAIVQNTVLIGTELAKAELELEMASRELQPNSVQLQLLRDKVRSLREQYGKVQFGGLVPGDGFSIPLDQVPVLMRRYANLVRDIKIKEQINAFLESQRAMERIQEEKDTPTIVIIDAPVIPEDKSAPVRSLMLVLAWFAFTLLFGVFVVVRKVLADPVDSI